MPQKKTHRAIDDSKINRIKDKLKGDVKMQDKNCLVEECTADERKVYEQKGQKMHVKSNNKAVNKAELEQIVQEAGLEGRAKNSVEMLHANF